MTQGCTAIPPLALLAVTLLCACGKADAEAEAVDSTRVTALAGCWGVEVGTFKGSRVDPGMTVLPTRVKLDTVPGVGISGEPDFWLARGLPSPNGAQYRDGRFMPLGSDRVLISWSNGFAGVTINARATTEQMRGTAQAWTDYGGEQVAPITLTRATCP